MVAFELSVAHPLNVVMLNNLGNEVLCCTLSLWGVVNVAYVFPSVPWSQRLIQPLSLAGRISNTLLSLNVYWPFRSSDSSVPVVAEWQCRSHCVFVLCKGGPLAGNIVNTLTAYCLVIHHLDIFTKFQFICRSRRTSTTVSCVSEKRRL